MGTRHLIAVVQGGEYKIASYNQWDGYPSGQGLTILRFLRDSNLDKFAEKVSKCSFLNDEEIEVINAEAKKNGKLPDHLSRDLGAKIFELVMNSDEPIKFHNSLNFAAEGLFCEWAYVVDLDKQTFEVYQGFKQTPVPEGQRFAHMNPDPATWVPDYEGQSLYYPVHLVKEYSMNNLHPFFLPNDEDFVKECEREEEDEVA